MFPPVRSMLGSLESDPGGVGIKAVLLCDMGSSEDRLLANAVIPKLANEGSGIKPVVLGSLFFCIWK